MLSVILMLVATPAIEQPPAVSQAEFEQQASACGVDMRYEPRGEAGYAARLNDGGRTLMLRTNQEEAGRNCLEQWGKARRLTVILWSN